jgi:deoxyadenosine/deoxycytidine kinase
MKKKPVVVVIDGVVGAGKTTMINECLLPLMTDRGWKVTVIEEPVEKWKASGILGRFYNDPKRFAYHFQTKAFVDRVSESIAKYEKHKNNTDLFILERSIFSDRLFVDMLLESGTMESFEYDDYYDWWKLWAKVMPFEPDLFVYLKPSIDVAMTRVAERSRSEENSLSREYQEKLGAKHDEFLGSEYVAISEYHFVPCMHLFTDANFRDDNFVKMQIVTDLENKINMIRNI